MENLYRTTIFIVGLFLIFLTIACACWNSGRYLGEWGLPTLIPDDPDVIMNRAMSEFRKTRGQLSTVRLEELRQAASLDLLKEEPLLIEALMESEFGEGHQAILFLEEARNRNPRLQEVRLFLLAHYLQSEDATSAVQEIGALSGLAPQLRTALVELLTGLVNNRMTRNDAIDALRSNPLRIAVLQDLASSGASAGLLLQMTGDMRGVSEETDKLVETFVDRDDLSGAYLLWSHFSDIDPQASGAAVFDGSFRGLAGPPFGWHLTSGSAGVAEMDSGSLYIQYGGRDGTVLARQLLLLPPGSYRLKFKTAKNGQQNPPNLGWRVDCLTSGAKLLDLPFATSLSFEDYATSGLTVPHDGCPGQWLALAGRPLEFPEVRSIQILEVSIDPVPAQ